MAARLLPHLSRRLCSQQTLFIVMTLILNYVSRCGGDPFENVALKEHPNYGPLWPEHHRSALPTSLSPGLESWNFSLPAALLQRGTAFRGDNQALWRAIEKLNRGEPVTVQVGEASSRQHGELQKCTWVGRAPKCRRPDPVPVGDE